MFLCRRKKVSAAGSKIRAITEQFGKYRSPCSSYFVLLDVRGEVQRKGTLYILLLVVIYNYFSNTV